MSCPLSTSSLVVCSLLSSQSADRRTLAYFHDSQCAVWQPLYRKAIFAGPAALPYRPFWHGPATPGAQAMGALWRVFPSAASGLGCLCQDGWWQIMGLVAGRGQGCLVADHGPGMVGGRSWAKDGWWQIVASAFRCVSQLASVSPTVRYSL